MKLLLLLITFSAMTLAQENCPCHAKPKPRPRSVIRKVSPVIQHREPQQRQEQDQENEQEQEQDQRQTVNVHVHSAADNYLLAARIAKASRSRFRIGLHAGCGPVGVKRILNGTINRYDLRNDLVVGGSLSVRLVGPVWLTGQAFSNRLFTGGLEIEF